MWTCGQREALSKRLWAVWSREADPPDLVLPKVDVFKKQQAQVSAEIDLLQKSLDELKNNVVSAIELREMLQSFQLLYQELPTHKQRELLGYIIKSITITPTQIEMALFGRASLERFTLSGGMFAGSQNWLPESFGEQNVFDPVRPAAGREEASAVAAQAGPSGLASIGQLAVAQLCHNLRHN